MAKIEQLYEAVAERDDSFLSFIPIALPFDADALSKAADGLAGDDALAALEASADFAILANYIPPVADIWSQDGRLLWDVYERVLSEARLAAPALSEGEKRRLQEARDLLTDPVTSEPTPRFLRYQDLQTAYVKAKERHAAAMLTAENSTDPAVVARSSAPPARGGFFPLMRTLQVHVTCVPARNKVTEAAQPTSSTLQDLAVEVE